jgi:hypothetical protein
MNYNKILNKKLKSDNKLKKVKWGENKSISLPHFNHPDGDFFNEFTKYNEYNEYNNGIKGQGLYKKNINSNVTKYLDKMKDSYSSIVYDTNPQIASIPINPEKIDIADDIDELTAQEIINDDNPNTRVLEYRENPKMFDSMTVGNIYDTLVDNFRVQWSKFNELDAYANDDYYSLDIKPIEKGYTGFATY